MEPYKVLGRTAHTTLIEDTSSGYLYTVGVDDGVPYIESDEEWTSDMAQAFLHIHDADTWDRPAIGIMGLAASHQQAVDNLEYGLAKMDSAEFALLSEGEKIAQRKRLIHLRRTQVNANPWAYPDDFSPLPTLKLE